MSERDGEEERHRVREREGKRERERMSELIKNVYFIIRIVINNTNYDSLLCKEQRERINYYNI